jgi:hypothetical protein
MPSRRARRRSQAVTEAMNSRSTRVVSVGSTASFVSQAVRHGEDPLPDRDVGQHIGHEAGGKVAHASTDAAGAKTTALARESDGSAPAAVATLGENKPVRQDSAAEKRFEFLAHKAGQAAGPVPLGLELLDEAAPVFLNGPVEDGLFRSVPVMRLGLAPLPREVGAVFRD